MLSCLLWVLYEDDKHQRMADFVLRGVLLWISCDWQLMRSRTRRFFTSVYCLEVSPFLPTLTIVIRGRARISTLPMQMSQSHGAVELQSDYYMRNKKWIRVTAEWKAVIVWLLEYKHSYILDKIFHLKLFFVWSRKLKYCIVSICYQ